MTNLKNDVKNKLEEELKNVSSDTCLNDDEIQLISDTLENNVSENNRKLRDIIKSCEESQDSNEFPYNTIKKEVIQSTAFVQSDVDSGVQKIVVGTNNELDTGLFESEEELDDIYKEKITEKNLEVAKDFGLTDEEAKKLFEIIIRFQNGENFNIYNELPTPCKKMADVASGNPFNIKEKRSAAKGLIKYFISEMKIEEGYMDLQNAIQKELSAISEDANVMDIHNDMQKDIMDKNLLDAANKLKETDPIKAENILNVRQAYLNAIEFKDLFNAVDNKTKDTKKLRKEIRKYSKYCRDFNYKYENNKLVIKDIRMVAKILNRYMDDRYTEEQIQMFTVLICRLYQTYLPSNIIHHTSMYYTINNITTLDFVKQEQRNNILNKISEIIDKLIEINK